MKIGMVVNKDLPAGLVANTTAVLGITLGNHKQEIIGSDCSEYTQKLIKTRNRDLEFSGLCLSGPKKAINRLTGSLVMQRVSPSTLYHCLSRILDNMAVLLCIILEMIIIRVCSIKGPEFSKISS